MELSLEANGTIRSLGVTKVGDSYRLTMDDQVYEARCRTLSPITRLLTYGGRVSMVYLVYADGAHRAWVAGHTFTLRPAQGRQPDRRTPGHLLRQGGQVCAPMPGKLAKLLVRVGERVHAGQRLAVVEAMKMEHDICAPSDGTVRKINFAENSLVTAGQPLLELELHSAARSEVPE